jgi:hypothetical protein
LATRRKIGTHVEIIYTETQNTQTGQFGKNFCYHLQQKTGSDGNSRRPRAARLDRILFPLLPLLPSNFFGWAFEAHAYKDGVVSASSFLFFKSDYLFFNPFTMEIIHSEK